MLTMNFFTWLKVNYPDEDEDDFKCQDCDAEMEYECSSCGQPTDCYKCEQGVDSYLGDRQEEIHDEYKQQKSRDEKLVSKHGKRISQVG